MVRRTTTIYSIYAIRFVYCCFRDWYKHRYHFDDGEFTLLDAPSENPQSNIFFETLYSVVTNGKCPEGAFAAGDKTAAECAEIIQNRVSIYLSENS